MEFRCKIENTGHILKVFLVFEHALSPVDSFLATKRRKVSKGVHRNVHFLFSSSRKPYSLPNLTQSNLQSVNEVLDENKTKRPSPLFQREVVKKKCIKYCLSGKRTERRLLVGEMYQCIYNCIEFFCILCNKIVIYLCRPRVVSFDVASSRGRLAGDQHKKQWNSEER